MKKARRSRFSFDPTIRGADGYIAAEETTESVQKTFEILEEADVLIDHACW